MYFVIQCRNFLEPTEIFKGEVEETLPKVHTAIRIMNAFKKCYDEHRLKIKDYFKNGNNSQQQEQQPQENGQENGDQSPKSEEPKEQEWLFVPELVFHRFDKFMQRVDMIRVSF